MEKLRTWIRHRPILWGSLILAVSVLIGLGIGAASSSQEVEDKDVQIEDLQEETDSLRDDLADAEQAATEAESAAAAQREQLSQQEAEVAQREEEVSAAEQTLEQNTIPDGIWELGRDYEAGTYRAPGGGGCYWALLGSADTADIINNGGFSRNQTITIDSPFFETSDCGEWVKIS